MATRKLIARAPIELWGRGVRGGDVFTTNAETEARLIEAKVAEVYGDQAKPNVPNYSGDGDALEASRRLAMDHDAATRGSA